MIFFLYSVAGVVDLEMKRNKIVDNRVTISPHMLQYLFLHSHLFIQVSGCKLHGPLLPYIPTSIFDDKKNIICNR